MLATSLSYTPSSTANATGLNVTGVLSREKLVLIASTPLSFNSDLTSATLGQSTDLAITLTSFNITCSYMHHYSSFGDYVAMFRMNMDANWKRLILTCSSQDHRTWMDEELPARVITWDQF